MYFDDLRKTLIISAELFNFQKTNTEIAASYFHEALYKTLRDQGYAGGKDSVLTRNIVGCLFSEKDTGDCLHLNPIDPPTDSTAWSCTVPTEAKAKSDVSFIAYKTDESEVDWNIMITSFGGVKFEYEAKAYLSRWITQIPVPGAKDDGLGDFVIGPIRIVGLEKLGNPISTKAYDADRYMKVIRKNPLTLERESGKTFRCKKLDRT